MLVIKSKTSLGGTFSNNVTTSRSIKSNTKAVEKISEVKKERIYSFLKKVSQFSAHYLVIFRDPVQS